MKIVHMQIDLAECLGLDRVGMQHYSTYSTKKLKKLKERLLQGVLIMISALLYMHNKLCPIVGIHGDRRDL